METTDFSSFADDIFYVSYNWSPNNRYLAFQGALALKGEKIDYYDKKLYVYDRDGRQLVDYCLKFTFPEMEEGGVGLPTNLITWSPDSQWLLFGITNQQQALVQLETGETNILPDGMWVWAWGE